MCVTICIVCMYVCTCMYVGRVDNTHVKYGQYPKRNAAYLYVKLIVIATKSNLKVW